jgi:MoaA/NifB/PqqE/SkfB family radical SAM enzyme
VTKPLPIPLHKIKLALRSPASFAAAARHVLRNSPVGEIDRILLNGYAFGPGIISINITSRCNLRCEMCMQPRDEEGDDSSPAIQGKQEELSPGQWIRFVNQVAPARPAFYFSGGEPLLYKELVDIIAHIKKCGLMAGMVTNGSFLAKYAEELVRAGIDHITVSLGGPGGGHDAIPGGPGAFRRAVEGIRALKNAKNEQRADFPEIKINSVITPQSLDTLAETYEIARGLGVDEFNLQHPIFDTARNVALHNRVFAAAFKLEERVSVSEFYEARLTEEEYDNLAGILDHLLSEPRVPRIQFFPKAPRSKWHEYYLNLDYPFRRACTMPWRIMRLLADGTFEPCMHYPIGNVADTHPLQLWNCMEMRQFRRILRNNGLFPGCVRCCYRKY